MKVVKLIPSLIFVIFSVCTIVYPAQLDLKIERDNRVESTHGLYSVFYPIPTIHPAGGSGGGPIPPIPPNRPQPPNRGGDDPSDNNPSSNNPFWDPNWTPGPRPTKSLKEIIEDEYGPLIPEMDFNTKQEILRRYPILNSGDHNDLLKIICLNAPELQRQIMRRVRSYSSNNMVDLFKTFEVYDEEVQRLYYLKGYPVLFSSNIGEYEDPLCSCLYEHAWQSITRERALTEEYIIEDYCRDLSNINERISTLVSPHEIHRPIKFLRHNISLFTNQAPAIAQELMHRDAYTSRHYPYQTTDRIKTKEYTKIIKTFGLEPSDLKNIFSTDPPPYLDSHGTLFHQQQKVLILDSVEELDTDYQSKKWPTLNALYPAIRGIYKSSLIESHDGYVVTPSRLWLTAQMMSLMARSHDKQVVLRMPFSFVDGSQLHREVESNLFRSQHLFYIETYRSLLQRLPGYHRWLDQLHQHFSDCSDCKFPCNRKCTKGKVVVPPGQDKRNLHIHITNEYNRLQQEEAQLKHLKDVIEQRREADRKERKEKLELVQQTGLGLVNHQDYIKSKLTQWKTERSQQLEDLREGTWQQQFLNDKAYALLDGYQCSARPFQQIYVQDDQLVFCNEYITLVNQTADTDWDASDMMQAHVQRTIIKFAEVGAWSLQADNREYTEALANLCRAFFEFGSAHLTTIHNPHPDITVVPGFIVGPVGTVGNDYGETVCNAAYHFANVLDTVCNITVTHQIDATKLPHEIAYEQVQTIKKELEKRQINYQYDFDPDNGLSEFAIRSLTYKESYQYAQIALTIAGIGLALVAPYIGGPGLAISASGTVALTAEYATSLCIAVAASAAHMLKPWIALYHESNDKGLGSKKQSGRYRNVKELLDDSDPVKDLRQSKKDIRKNTNVKEHKLRGDANKIFADLAESYGKKIEVKGDALTFGEEPNVVSLHPSKTGGRLTISFEVGGIKYKIRIDL